VPQRAGNQLAVAPGAVINTYLSADEVWITVTSGTPRSVSNIAELLGEPADEYRTVSDSSRGRNARQPPPRLDRRTPRRGVPRADGEARGRRLAHLHGQDIVNDPIYAEREDIVEIEDADLGTVRMQAVVPKMGSRPGSVWRTGPSLGQDNDLVLGEWLGKSDDELAALRSSGTI